MRIAEPDCDCVDVEVRIEYTADAAGTDAVDNDQNEIRQPAEEEHDYFNVDI